MLKSHLKEVIFISEGDTVNKVKRPITIERIINDLKKIGVEKGMTLIVHSSLSSIGWVSGGPVAVIYALEELLSSEGTLVMPTHSGDLSEPSKWVNPPVPEEWWPIIRQTMPPFEKNITPTRKMGAIAETFRKQRDVLRSNHPQLSFCAWGKNTEFITSNHPLEYSLNDNSPLGKIYDLKGSILLLGVDHSNNTSLHLAEYRADYKSKKTVNNGAPIIEKGKRIWKEFQDISINSDDFNDIGRNFQKEFKNKVKIGKIGDAMSIFVNQKELVDFATLWMEKNRK